MRITPTRRRPPRLAVWTLGKLLPYDPDRYALGDIEEVFQYIAHAHGPTRAALWYWKQVVLALPASLNNASYWGVHMLTHYVKTALRSYRKNRAASVINTLGLSIAVGSAVALFIFIDIQLNMGDSHENGEEIYLVESVVESGGQEVLWGHSPVPLGAAMQQAVPQVIGMARMAGGRVAMRHESSIFTESVSFVDPAFLDVFTFPLRYGEAGSLARENTLVLSAPVAEKYFGEANPVGNQVAITFQDTRVEIFTVGGVAEPIPLHAGFGFNILIAYEKQRDLGRDLEDWAALTSATYVRLAPAADRQGVEAQLASFVGSQQAADPDRPMARFVLMPFLDVPTQMTVLRESPLAQVHPSTAWICGLMALMILAISCFNYINFSLVAAARRAREIGVRKVVGSYRWQLVAQFLGENLVHSLFALALGLVLAATVLIPGLDRLMGIVGYELNYKENVDLWVYLGLVLLVTALGAGLYPALYISNFQPARVLKGLQTLTGKNRLTRVLLVCQFVFSFVLMAFAMAAIQIADYQREQDWGYTQAQTLILPFRDPAHYPLFKNELAAYPHILRQAGTVDHVGRGGQNAAVSFEGVPFEVRRFDVGFNYLETMKLRLREGRSFDEQRQTDIENAVVVNETFLQAVDGAALGQTLTVGGQSLEIVGVVDDFYYRPFFFAMEPVVFRVVEEEALEVLAVDVRAGSVMRASDHMKATWARLFPDIPYEGYFQDSIFDSYFQGIERSARVFLFISLIALFIALMGLFGLVPLTIARRMKEIGIRKVLGASRWDVIGLIQKDLVVVLAVALVIGGGLSALATQALLSFMLANTWQPDGWTFILPAAVILVAAFGASFSGVYKGARVNPIDTLRMGAD